MKSKKFFKKSRDGSSGEKTDDFEKSKIELTDPVTAGEDSAEGNVRTSVEDNIFMLRELFGQSFDLVIKRTDVCGIPAAFAVLDGMYDNLLAAKAVVEPIQNMKFSCPDAKTVFERVSSQVSSECDVKESVSADEAVGNMLSGCLLFFLDGVGKSLSFSVQGYVKRSVEPPESETQVHGSHEGFADMYKDNVTLVRRRLKSPFVRFETLTVGESSKTAVCICYHAKRADARIVSRVRDSLKCAELDIVPGAGAVKPFLDSKGLSFFSSVGTTERPDVFAAKLAEGRVGVIVDGVPYALIVPYLFIENFHTLDDYLSRPYYTAVSRTLRIFCFLASVLLPGVYVCVGTYHQEILPADVIFEMATSLQSTPFPLVIEALVIHFIYEIVSEAGLRMPQAMGHAVSIVGALVIGDAAVTAGLISAPMLIVVAITAICTAVVFPLHQSASVLRLIFILLGGFMGLYGVMIGFFVVFVNICSVDSFGVPFTSPVSPFNVYAQRDVVLFGGWRNIGKRYMKIQNVSESDKYVSDR